MLSSSGVTTEELEDYVDRLNEHVSGHTTAEKEDLVVDLIHNTPARVRPGVRNLPFYLYKEGETIPPRSDVDRQGLPGIASEDEVVVARHSEYAKGARKKGQTTLPSTTANLPEAHTDSEKSGSSGGSVKRKTPESVSVLSLIRQGVVP